MPRSRVLPVLVLSCCALLVAACGGGGDGDDSGGGAAPAQPAAAQKADFPPTTGKSLVDITSNLPEGPVLAPSVSVLGKGTNRIGFALFDTAGKQLAGADVALYIGSTDGSSARGPFTARSESLKVAPQFESKQTATDPDSARAVYVADVPFKRNGKYALLAIARLDGRMVATSPIAVKVGLDKVTPPAVGDKAPVIHTLTPADVSGNLAKIDTRLPPAENLLKDDFADVVGKKPIVITFATPQLCQSRVCGPVVDVVDEVAAKVGDKVSFIHQEVYVDNDIAKGVRPQLTTYKLQSEPWTYVIDKRGVIASRFEGAFSSGELERAVAKVS